MCFSDVRCGTGMATVQAIFGMQPRSGLLAEEHADSVKRFFYNNENKIRNGKNHQFKK